jgi:hypothetical protein
MIGWVVEQYPQVLPQTRVLLGGERQPEEKKAS